MNRRRVVVTGIVVFVAYQVMGFFVHGLWLGPTCGSLIGKVWRPEAEVELILIDDQQMRQAMRLLYDEMKLVVELAGAAATAALCGPLSERLSGKRVGLIVCGSNIDPDTFHRFIS